MRKLIPIAALLVVLSTTALLAHSATPADIVAAGRQSLLAVDAGNDRVGLIEIATGSVKRQMLPFTIESAVVYDDASGTFRGFGRARSGGNSNLVLWSLHEVNGTVTCVKTPATRVEAFVKSPTGRLFARLRDDQNVLYSGIVGIDGINAVAHSDDSRRPTSDVVLSGHEVVSASEGTVLVEGNLERLSVPLSTRNDRLWHETRLKSGWLLIDPMTGDTRLSRDGSTWALRSPIGGTALGTVMPYSVESTLDGAAAYVVSTIGDVNDRRRLLSRVDTLGNATPVVEFGKNLEHLVAGPNAMWLVGGAADEATIRFAAVTPSGIGPIRSIAWPAD